MSSPWCCATSPAFCTRSGKQLLLSFFSLPNVGRAQAKGTFIPQGLQISIIWTVLHNKWTVLDSPMINVFNNLSIFNGARGKFSPTPSDRKTMRWWDPWEPVAVKLIPVTSARAAIIGVGSAKNMLSVFSNRQSNRSPSGIPGSL